jgi:hypothetical protein
MSGICTLFLILVNRSFNRKIATNLSIYFIPKPDKPEPKRKNTNFPSWNYSLKDIAKR